MNILPTHVSGHEADLIAKPTVTTGPADTKEWSPMTTKEGKHCWDPYETSHRKHFVLQPKSSAEIALRPKSTSLIDSHTFSGPFGSTVYNEDFFWIAASKAECIRTATASGNRRNNPHPSKAFMTWRMPREAAQSSENVLASWKCPPSDKEISEALTAQYCSTYKCDFLHKPQGYYDINTSTDRLANLCVRRNILQSIDTKQKPELLHKNSSFTCDKILKSTIHRGIVPTVVQRHAHQRGSDLTTYERFFGKRIPDVTSVLKSRLPQDLQQLHRSLPKAEKEAVKRILSGNGCSNNKDKIIKLPAVVRESCLPDWISTWPGPF